ncbi:MBL fold metallo-hydrolase [Marinoscillum pacificum]|uniref:MBL fold metallo-hydrolase n=1 Tax=Marinoscillum pacificum TaxID=392723 RepID=UPI002157D720|nr:MBL fold metallo-hydrolase [Marinoscillum pacificum]
MSFLHLQTFDKTKKIKDLGEICLISMVGNDFSVNMVIYVLLGFFLVISLVLGAGVSLSAPGHKGPATDHFNGKKFINPTGAKAKGFSSVIEWMLKSDKGPWLKNYETSIGPKPVDSSTDLIITFVNHSTFLIQWNNINILTDPVWSERVSPFSFAGPSRMRPPGINFEDLPPIDVILLSHNHYDHLDIVTVKKINTLYEPVFIVPLGVGKYLAQHKITKFKELDWWQSSEIGLKVTATPAQHFSSRGMCDRDKTLWCGYTLTDGERKVYFAGDSGYGPFFKEIGKKEGPMDVSMIPIGAYEPKWFMSPIHVSPDQSVMVHKDVKSKQSIAMHFGTFPLADEGQGKAEEDLILALDSAGIPQSEFLIPEEGEPMKL